MTDDSKMFPQGNGSNGAIEILAPGSSHVPTIELSPASRISTTTC